MNGVNKLCAHTKNTMQQLKNNVVGIYAKNWKDPQDDLSGISKLQNNMY